MEFSERLKQLRNEQRYSQAEIAKAIGIAQPVYARYETGERKPDYDNLIKIAELFQVSTDYLLGKTDIRYSQESIAMSSDIPYDELPPEAVKQIHDYIAFIKEQHQKNK